MKKTFTSIPLFVLLCLCFTSLKGWAQTGSVAGKIIDEKSQPVSYATVQLKGTQYGANTDDDGTYTITNVPTGTYTINVTYVGYANYEQAITVTSGPLTVDIQLKTDYLSLNEVVVVGYGTKQVKDLTGSVSSVSAADFQKGNVATMDQLITGKIAGVQITSNGGAPGSGSTIRIRGGTSLNASNDPLIVIDGVPVDNNGPVGSPTAFSGSSNPLNLINPDDIENITILKDASAAAIYGSRAANGVIIITTKKGSADAKFNVEFSTNGSFSELPGFVDVLSADELRALIDSTGNDNQKKLLGSSNTNWQDEIYRTGFSSDNNLTLGGGIKMLPYRLSVGYLHDEGVLLRSEFDRVSTTLNLNPKFFDDHLKVDLNFKFGYTHNFFADQGAIGSAVTFDPTQPVHSDTTTYGGYFEWLTPSTGKPNTLAPKNPVGLINQKDDKSNVYRYIGNIQFDYKFHFLPDLRANLNLGGDWSRANGTVFIDSNAAAQFLQGGQSTQYEQQRDNKLFEFYLNYGKELKDIHSKFDVTGGYSYQDWIISNPTFAALNAKGDTITPAGIPFKTQHTLISFYGRLNYAFMDRYLLTATLRDDGSSRFSPDNRWGLFPSIALAWRISDESFMRNSNTFSNLKLRLGYGVTGQQDVNADYPYIANYAQGDPTAQYQFGDQFYYVLRPDGYDANIKWEQTETYNAGLDFGFINGRISGTVDVYDKLTKDLLALIPVPAGSNFTNNILTNVGSLENKGVELTLDFVPFDDKDFGWEFGGNVTYNKNEITKLTKVQDTSSVGIPVGGISGAVGNTVQIQSVGYPIYTFYLYHQLYNEDGKPIEGSYQDVNGDSIINQDDKLHSKNPAPKVYMGFSSTFRYKNWTLGFSLRGSFGNYVYNNVKSQYDTYSNVDGSKNYMANLTSSYYEAEFQKSQYLSDYYLEDASFVRMDNINLGYNFKHLINDKLALRITGVVQNVFVISSYSGLDPEVFNGIDNNIYPRPRIFSLILDLKL